VIINYLNPTTDPFQQSMNDDDIQQFMNAFDDFMQHHQVEEAHYLARKKYESYQRQSKKFIQNEIETKARQMNVTTEYYLQEFV
jgi:hypothetical protein